MKLYVELFSFRRQCMFDLQLIKRFSKRQNIMKVLLTVSSTLLLLRLRGSNELKMIATISHNMEQRNNQRMTQKFQNSMS